MTQHAPDSGNTTPVVVGVDFGTLSGRAVVVRVPTARSSARRARLRARRSWTATLPARHAGCRRTGPCRCPRTTSTCSAHAVPASARGRAASTPPSVIGIGTDFTACTVLPTTADGTPLCELPGARRPAARLRQAVEAPRGPAAGRPDQRAGRTSAASRGSRATAGRSPPSGSSPRACSCWRRTPRSTPGPSAGSRRRTGSSGSCAARYVRNACTAGYKGIYQDGTLPAPGLPGRAEPGLRRLRRREARPARSASSATAPAALTERGGGAGPGCRRASPSRSATSTPT